MKILRPRGGGGGGALQKFLDTERGALKKLLGLEGGGGSKNLYTSKPTGGLGGGPKKLNC